MYKLWIGNEHQESAGGQTFAVINPATEEIVDHAPRSNAQDVNRAVEAADHAFREWRHTPGLERAEMMHEFARRLRADRNEIATVLTLEGGKPLIENLDEVEWVA